jgi:hypothetical protein
MAEGGSGGRRVKFVMYIVVLLGRLFFDFVMIVVDFLGAKIGWILFFFLWCVHPIRLCRFWKVFPCIQF